MFLVRQFFKFFLFSSLFFVQMMACSQPTQADELEVEKQPNSKELSEKTQSPKAPTIKDIKEHCRAQGKASGKELLDCLKEKNQ